MADRTTFKLKVICPDRIFYDGEVTMVELNTSDGEVGIYQNHVPTTMIIAPGVLKITEVDGTKKAALHSGFIEVLQDQMTILAEVAEWPEEIDVRRAEEAKIRAERRIETNDSKMNILRAEIALKKSLIRIKLSGK